MLNLWQGNKSSLVRSPVWLVTFLVSLSSARLKRPGCRRGWPPRVCFKMGHSGMSPNSNFNLENNDKHQNFKGVRNMSNNSTRQKSLDIREITWNHFCMWSRDWGGFHDFGEILCRSLHRVAILYRTSGENTSWKPMKAHESGVLESWAFKIASIHLETQAFFEHFWWPRWPWYLWIPQHDPRTMGPRSSGNWRPLKMRASEAETWLGGH